MGASTTINVRLPEQLKLGGGKVLEKTGVSPTELVRSVYRYMDRHQKLPECLDVAPCEQETKYRKRRELLRRFDGFAVDLQSDDCKVERARRIEDKYGDLL